MPAGKKTDAETVKTRTCIVYVKNLREGRLPAVAATGKAAAGAAAKSNSARTINHRNVAIAALPSAAIPLRATRTSRRSATISTEIILGGKARQRAAVENDKLSPPAAVVAARRLRQSKGDLVPTPSHPARRQPPSLALASPTTPKSTTIQPAKRLMGPGLAAKRRNSALPSTAAGTAAKHLSTLATSTIRRNALNARRATQTQDHIISPKTPKMYKQQSKVSPHVVSVTPPPTIAASRSRRSIKPNPKYASEDLVTPKYLASMASSDTPSSRQQRGGGNSSSKLFSATKYNDMHDLLDLDEDNDDELNDVAYNPQMHKSDDDDDDLSEDEYQEEMRREKIPAPVPPVKRGRGRPPKSANAAAAAATSTPQPKLASSVARQSTNLQQMRRTMAVTMGNRSNNNLQISASEGAAKRKLEDATDSPVARKRMVLAAAGGPNRSLPVINGSSSAGKPSPAASAGRPKTLIGSSASNSGLRTGPTTAAGLINKQRPAATTAIKMNSSKPVGGAAAAARSTSIKAESSKIVDDVPTFTIVNINDIINQDDVLISRTNNPTASILNAASKKLSVGRPRTRNILVGDRPTKGSGSAEMPTSSSTPTSNSSAQGGFSSSKRVKASATFIKKQQQQQSPPQQTVSQSQSQNQTKPRPRILNAEMGKKAKPIKPVLSLSQELYPTDVDTEEDDADIDLDLDEVDLTLSPPAPARRAAPAAAATNRGQAAATATAKAPAPAPAKYTARRPILSSNATTNSSRNYGAGDRKLAQLLGEANEESFKKPPINVSPAAQQQRRYSKENKSNSSTTTIVIKDQDTDDDEADNLDEDEDEEENENKGKKNPKYFPPETTTVREEDGRVIKKITCYETWHVISNPRELPEKTRQQRTLLELPLVKLANVAARIKMPSAKWSSKVTLYKVSPTLMQRQTMTIFTGDLKVYNIPEEDRHKYQPSCVLFRRVVVDRSKCRVPYDRAIIFKNRCFYANIDGKHVNLMGAPETVGCMKDVEILLDIVDTLSLNSQLVETVNSK
ncbi:nucleolar protein dao-5 [Drosophila miranda]|uniref:nucleolar protein dao-5 n=1 Tax=Drosophila miranda TaxID=7229 RepID=UPI0007E6D10C|nr:nucleolar protein dao-5 [Drosophila miranda]